MLCSCCGKVIIITNHRPVNTIKVATQLVITTRQLAGSPLVAVIYPTMSYITQNVYYCQLEMFAVT